MLTARPGRWPIGVAVALALVWSTAPLLADLLARRLDRRTPRRAGPVEPAPGPIVTTILRRGDEPDEVARASLRMAEQAGPVVVLPAGEPLDAALAQVRTDAVLLVSGRSVPEPDACRTAAGLLDDDIGWVTGRTEPFSEHGFVPDARDARSARLRDRARRAGLALWEPDATLVTADLLRDHPLPSDRPWGTWLRDRSDDGLRGASTDAVLAYRSSPADAESFWPDTLARQRAAAADLARATRHGRLARRVLALLLLADETYAVGLVAWLAVPVLLGASGEFPSTVAPWWALGAVGSCAALRWSALRTAQGLRPRLRDDLTAALHHLPGSLAAVPASLTGRLRSRRGAVPRRPLVWAALALTVLAGVSLVDRGAGATSKASVGTSLAALALLWAYSMRSLVQRSWQRRTARLPLELPATISGVDGRTLDASPGGLALRGPFDPGSVRRGEPLEVELGLDDGTRTTLRTTVASVRTGGRGTLLGLQVDLDDDSTGPWLAQVLRAAARPQDRRSRAAQVSTTLDDRAVLLPARVARAGERLVHGLAAGVSIVLVAALALVLLGYRPLVIRSGSMEPTLRIGDVVLAEQVPAHELRPGDVVTQPGRGGMESMTHRVVSLRQRGSELRVSTLGDANEVGESWTVGTDDLVGRMRWTVPWIGRIATGVRTSGAQLALGSAALALALVVVLRPSRAPERRQVGHTPA